MILYVINKLIRKPKNIPTPPNLTIIELCFFLSFGISTKLYLKPNLLIKGINKTDITREKVKLIVDIMAINSKLSSIYKKEIN